jgi:NTE family protein
MSLGLVLSGGGVRGAAHIGVLKALHEANIKPQMVTATSAGSIVAGLYAYGYQPDEIALIARQISPRYLDVDYGGVIGSLLSLFCHGCISVKGLIKGDQLESLLYRLTKGASLSKAKIPTALTAVDINNASIVLFTSFQGRLMRRDDFIFLPNRTFAEAIRASIAIPGVFKPKILDKMQLVDGGVRDNLPVDIIRLMGAKKVIAVNLGYSGNPVPYVKNIAQISMQALDLMIYQISLPNLDSANVTISPTIDDVAGSDLSQIEYFIQCGYLAGRQAIPKIKEMLLTDRKR